MLTNLCFLVLFSALAQNVLFSNRLFLLGFRLTAVITIVNGVRFYFPVVPNLRLRTNISNLFPERPWNAIGWMSILG